MARKLYEPQPIAQDTHGCLVAVLTNVAIMLDGDGSTFETVSHELQRAPGAYVNWDQSLKWALETRGYKTRTVTSFDYERLRVEGPDYVLGYHPDDNAQPSPRDFYAQNFDNILVRHDRRTAWLQPYKKRDRYIAEVREITSDDFVDSIEAGQVVTFDAFAITGNSLHSMLAFKRKGEMYVFYPRLEYTTETPAFQWINKEWFGLWRYDLVTTYSR